MKNMIGWIGLSIACVTSPPSTIQHSQRDDSSALVKAMTKSRHSLTDGIRQLARTPEDVLSAKFEFDHKGRLSLSIYTAEKGLGVDAEHNVLKEYSGSPESAAWTPEAEVFKDVEHVARAAQQQTLMALANFSMLDLIARAESETKGVVLSVTPVLQNHDAFLAIETVKDDKVIRSKYRLLDDEEDDDKDSARH